MVRFEWLTRLRLESKILVLQIAQALAEQRRCCQSASIRASRRLRPTQQYESRSPPVPEAFGIVGEECCHQCDDYRMYWQGELLNIHVAPKASAPMVALSEVRLVTGIGLEGDRYATGLGSYSKKHHIDRQATLIEVEVLEALARDRDIELAPHEHRRNLTTRGVPLNHLVGQYFRIGDCVLYGGRLNVPCLYLENLLAKKVFKALLNRSGLNCRIVVGGIIRTHDRVQWCEPGSLDVSVRLANEAIPLQRPPEV
jgi:MOSC domain-containing protein YiiM